MYASAVFALILNTTARLCHSPLPSSLIFAAVDVAVPIFTLLLSKSTVICEISYFSSLISLNALYLSVVNSNINCALVEFPSKKTSVSNTKLSANVMLLVFQLRQGELTPPLVSAVVKFFVTIANALFSESLPPSPADKLMFFSAVICPLLQLNPFPSGDLTEFTPPDSSSVSLSSSKL